jgi:glucose-1-phosphate cytidylyltransferase
MKAVILAGGLGTRIAEESHLKPKPMVEIGGRPILWHIMKTYTHYGITDFVICLGHMGYVIKEYFSNYFLHMSNVTMDLRSNSMEIHDQRVEPWRVTLIDTGELTHTGGRLKRIQEHLGDECFCMTYGDGVGNVDIGSLIDFHNAEGRLATVTAVQAPGRFGALSIAENKVTNFVEKPIGDGSWINGGFFVLSPEVLKYIDGDEIAWEQEPMSRLAEAGEMAAFRHEGFWQPMDTMRDKGVLEALWTQDDAPWKIW